jgi:hypothetical protein
MPPYIGKKNVYYEDPVFKSRMCGAAFTTREEAVLKAESTIKKIAARRWFDIKLPPEQKDMEMGDDEISAMMEKYGGVLDDELDDEPTVTAIGDETGINKNFL